jgi:hypothetical protein
MRMAQKFSISIISILITLIAPEVAFCSYRIAQGGLDWRRARGKDLTLYKDEKLGWRVKANFSGGELAQDFNYFETGPHGFRAYGDPHSDRVKILFIGDSFTAANAVSSKEAYYGVIKNRLAIETFAYGGGNYGTL